jgi:hypothetical protein
VRVENQVFGAARAAEKTGCQRGFPGVFYQRPKDDHHFFHAYQIFFLFSPSN